MRYILLRVAVFAVAISFALPLAAAETSKDPSKIIKIGVASALTGDIASHGIPSLHGAVLAADYINGLGGVLGMQVEIVAQDDQCKPELATNAATKLVSEKVSGIIGHICSGATRAALPIYNEAKLITISSASTSPGLTTSGENPYFFRTIVNDNDQGKLAVDYILKKMDVANVAILHDNGEYGRGYAETTRALLEKAPDSKAKVVLFEAVNPDAVDFSAVVLKMRREKVDALILGAYHHTAAKLLQQMRREKLSATLIGPDSLKADSFIEMAGPDSEGALASSPKDTSKISLTQEAAEQHRKKYSSEPGPFFDNAYSATLALLNAMTLAGTYTDTDKIAQALRDNYVETPSGRIKFSPTGDAIGVGLSMYQVTNGKFVELDHYILMD